MAPTFYHQQVLKIKGNVFPNDDLCRQVMQAKDFMDKHFADKIALKDISCSACYSSFHFLRLFKLMYGKTPHQYLTDVRIEKAKEFLKIDLPVSVICFSVGFESIGSFKMLFRRNTGYTPHAYRQHSLRKNVTASSLKYLPFFFSLKKSNFQDGK